MTATALISWLPFLLGFGGPGGSGYPTVTRMTVEEQLIIKVPVRPHPLHRSVNWEERKGPKCLDTDDLRGAVLASPTAVDFALRDRTWVRARFSENCPALDFYRGFYLKPDDERICAKRDFVHSRMGRSCQIERFRTLRRADDD